MLPGDTEKSAMRRLLKNEINAPVSLPELVGVVHTPKGTTRTGDDGCLRGQVTSLLFSTVFAIVHTRRSKRVEFIQKNEFLAMFDRINQAKV